MDSMERAIKNEFLQEARELSEELERALLNLSRINGNSADELLNATFRLMHTIKGSAMVAGFGDLGSFAHVVESLLAKLRERQLACNDAIIDVLLRANDRTRQIIRALTDDFEAVVSTADILADLRSYLDASQTQESAVNSSAPRKDFAIFTDAIPQSHAGVKTDPISLTSESGAPAILICDDDRELREVLCEFVTALGLECSQASSGREGLELAQAGNYDVILTDLKMPDMDGATMVEQLRMKRFTTPVIFLSGFAEQADVLRLFKLGAYDFLEKPVVPSRLESVVLNALHLKRVRDASVRLSKYSFKAFVTLSMTLERARTGDLEKAGVGLEQTQSLLEVIASLTHYIVTSRVSDQPLNSAVA